jgi:hypothetical protein
MLSHLVITEDATIRTALERLDQSAISMVVVCQGDLAVGVLTDGDVRRAFLRGVGLFAGSQVIGRSELGDGCLISAGTTVLNTHVPAGYVCFHQAGKPDYKASRQHVNSLFLSLR